MLVFSVATLLSLAAAAAAAASCTNFQCLIDLRDPNELDSVSTRAASTLIIAILRVIWPFSIAAMPSPPPQELLLLLRGRGALHRVRPRLQEVLQEDHQEGGAHLRAVQVLLIVLVKMILATDASFLGSQCFLDAF